MTKEELDTVLDAVEEAVLDSTGSIALSARITELVESAMQWHVDGADASSAAPVAAG